MEEKIHSLLFNVLVRFEEMLSKTRR